MLPTNSLEIELTTKCTLGCPSCPRNNPYDSRKLWDVGHIDTDLVLRLADEVEQDNTRVLFVGCYGDPIYHPDFINIMKVYAEKKISVLVHTNASFKTDKWWKELVWTIPWNNKIEFEFSVDGLEDTNHLYRINSKWKSIQTGMQELSKYIKQQNDPAKIPQVSWKFLVFPYNEHQVNEAQELCNDYGFKFYAAKSERTIASYRVENNYIYDWKGKGDLSWKIKEN
jgi:MoaA/NifB/PqqE/SkfB family radical SAM enzyme